MDALDPAAGPPSGALTAAPGDGLALLLRSTEGLRTVYQPVVDLRTGDVVGYEALTRVAEWPARSPEPWFAAAERQGLGPAIEAAALGSALRVRPQLAPGQLLAVNVAAGALSHPDVTQALLGEPDLHDVVVELSDLGTADPGPLAAALGGLRERGLLVAGCVTDGGRTELSRVVAVGADFVELGPGLVRGVGSDPLAARVVRLVLDVAAGLGAKVVASGVEALEDARALQAAGVHHGRGWLFGRARAGLLLPSPEVVAWLREGARGGPTS